MEDLDIWTSVVKSSLQGIAATSETAEDAANWAIEAADAVMKAHIQRRMEGVDNSDIPAEWRA